MKSRRRYSVLEKPLSKKSKLSLALAGISAAAFLFCIIVSAIFAGDAATFIGAVALAAMLLALYGCYLGIRELAEPKSEFRKSYLGAIVSGVMFIVWMTVFLTGVKM